MNTITEWHAAYEAHSTRVDALVSHHEQRQSRGQAHPIEDFLFTYYVYRPNQLRRWHPGLGYAIADADAPHRDWPFYRVSGGLVGLDEDQFWAKRSALTTFVRRLMRATLHREPQHNCFGMHEWAMVYRLGPTDIRHAQWPLRRSAEDIAAAVDDRDLRCTHFDAYRFFSPAATPLNAVELSRESQLDREQPGCLHAGMDLYKWAYKLAPATPSALVLDAFELARDIRYVDMQASPYDFADLGIRSIDVDTAPGRAQYAAAQRVFTERAAPIRERLLDVCEQLTASHAATR